LQNRVHKTELPIVQAFLQYGADRQTDDIIKPIACQQFLIWWQQF